MDQFSQGYLRDSEGALVVIFKSLAVLPLRWQGGYLLDADGALVIASKS